jgi:hypothetical protein
MDPLANPYTPNAGARPPALVGRDRQIADFELLIARLSRGHTEKSMIITGLRGVGKTVLLGRFRQIAEAAHWAVIEWEISRHDDPAFRRTPRSSGPPYSRCLPGTGGRNGPTVRPTRCARSPCQSILRAT